MPEWLSWTSGIASIAGFALSVAVLVVACLWKRMAASLLAAVRARTLAEGLGAAQSELLELADALARRDARTSLYIGRRAQTRVGTVLARRAASLSADDLTDLNAARSLLVRLQGALSTADEADPRMPPEATAHARRSSDLVARVLGHVQSSVDLSVGKEW